MFRKLRTYFLAGLVVTAPIGITAWLTWWFVSLFDAWIKPYLPEMYNPDYYLSFHMPGVGLVVALFLITVIGALAANLVGRTLINFWESMLDRMPVIRTVYRGVKQIFQTAIAQSSSNFKEVALIEYPRKGIHVVVFIARELDSSEIGLEPGTALYSAFMPTTPNPTSGFLFFLKKEEARILDLTVEEGAKLVISAGLVTPKQIQTQDDSITGLDAETVKELEKHIKK